KDMSTTALSDLDATSFFAGKAIQESHNETVKTQTRAYVHPEDAYKENIIITA
ncbi:hypothetical protein Tco_1049076, partial [Tanacetum coccineum]